MDRLIRTALMGKPVAWFAPNYRLLSDAWPEVQATLHPEVAKLNQKEAARATWRGVVEMWSSDSADAGRGRALLWWRWVRPPWCRTPSSLAEHPASVHNAAVIFICSPPLRSNGRAVGGHCTISAAAASSF